MKITMKDIAERTGYSISTVSRVLSNSSRISDKAKKDILKVARQLNYDFNFSPNLSQNNSKNTVELKNVALITDFHEGEFYASYFYGLSCAAIQENVRLSLYNVQNPTREVGPFIKSIVNEGYFDGIILFIPELIQRDYIAIMKHLPADFPVVSNALINNPHLPTITFDGYSGGNQTAKHFDKLGFRKVGIAKGPKSKAESRFRTNGFRDYIENCEHMELLWEYEGNFEYQSGVDAFYNLFESSINLDAVFVSNDLMANAFIDSAQYHGFNIPEDIAVTGYDNLPMCEQNYPRITSITTDFFRLGTFSIRQLKLKTGGNDDYQGTLSLIPVELIARESTLEPEEKHPSDSRHYSISSM